MTQGFRFDATVIPTNNNGFTSNFSNSYSWIFEPTNTINSGDVRTSDVYRFLPAPYILATGEITAPELKRLIEFNLNEVYSSNSFEQNGGWTLGFSSIDLTVAGCARPLEVNPTITLCGYPGYFENVVSLVDANGNSDIPANDFFIDRLLIGDVNKLSQRKNIIDNAKTKMWPDSQYVPP